jgi:hypothetical protein
MKTFRIAGSAILAAASLLGVSGAFAAGQGVGSTSQYQAERAACNPALQDRAACAREAGAAQQAARQGQLTSAPAEVYAQNALARCQLQPPSDRIACEDRVRGTGATSIEGSVLGGGAIRETVTPVPASPTLN